MPSLRRKDEDFTVIAVSHDVRAKLKQMKGSLSYDDFLRKRLGMRVVRRPKGRPSEK